MKEPSRFVWAKKIEQDLAQGIPPLQRRLKKKRQKELVAELEKVKKRREQQAIEKTQHEKDIRLLTRVRRKQEYQHWEKNEDKFLFVQNKKRSEIRLQEGRPKPIDVLYQYINTTLKDSNEPCHICKSLSVTELEDLQMDIDTYCKLDRASPTHVKFWESMMAICNWKIVQVSRGDIGGECRFDFQGKSLGAHDMNNDIDGILQPLSVTELGRMQEEIKAKMVPAATQAMPEFWESVLQRFPIYIAFAQLRQIHVELYGKQTNCDPNEKRPLIKRHNVNEDKLTHHSQEGASSTQQHLDKNHLEYEEGDTHSSSPKWIVQGIDDSKILHPKVDEANLKRKRAPVLDEQQRIGSYDCASIAIEDNPHKSAPLGRASMMNWMEGIQEGDTTLGQGFEVVLASKQHWWHDKYKPPKPKYFNKVLTSYEWNKYNQVHYDHNNLPPKIVQGYKFNIFYHDLVEKNKAPTYFVEKDESGSGGTCLLHFHAGPPYKDIVFRIVNKDWEYSRKKGFKCTFEGGILQLYFNFIRYRYRR